MAEAQRIQQKTWSKDHYLISTDPSLIPLEKLNQAFASSDVYWALPMPLAALQETLSRSLCFGLYSTPSSPSSFSPTSSIPEGQTAQAESEKERDLVGFARCVTDFTTFVYVTDVYVWPSHQGLGLGRWLMGCVREVTEGMPFLRRSVLFTRDWERSVPFYRGVMGMDVLGEGEGEGKGVAVMQRKGRAFPDGFYGVLQG